MTGVFMRRGRDTETLLQEKEVEMETETGMMHLQAKEGQDWLAAPEAGKRHGSDSLPEPSEKAWLC